ncbi:MAG TPA: N-acetyltransferase [Caldimonas sp.]|nr:N-acetyltransferase [Caldimonas sp.]
MSVPARAAPAAFHDHRAPPSSSSSSSSSPFPRLAHPLHEELVELEDESRQRFKIFAVKQASELRRASALLQRRYAWRGYSVAPLEARTRRSITLTASSGGTTVATITAALDSAEGLFVEALYPDCVAELRQPGRKLCEFTKFAVDESVRSQALLGAVFHVACMYVLDVHRCTDALIEVNPRHVRFYEQMLGFTCAANERLDPSVNAAAVLMRLDLGYCAGEIGRLAGAGRAGRRERSFYPHFFSRDVADEVVSRLRTH